VQLIDSLIQNGPVTAGYVKSGRTIQGDDNKIGDFSDIQIVFKQTGEMGLFEPESQ